MVFYPEEYWPVTTDDDLYLSPNDLLHREESAERIAAIYILDYIFKANGVFDWWKLEIITAKIAFASYVEMTDPGPRDISIPKTISIHARDHDVVYRRPSEAVVEAYRREQERWERWAARRNR